MYDKVDGIAEIILLCKSIRLLRDLEKFYLVGRWVLDLWVISSEENLSNTRANRKAWLGQAACSFNHKAPERVTRKAWKYLTEEEQVKANNIANKLIHLYESKSRKLHKNLGR